MIRYAKWGAILCLCSCTQTALPPGHVPVTTVVDKLKQELDLFAKTPPTIPIRQELKAICVGLNGQPIASIVPTKAELTLKVTTSNSYGGSIGLKIPTGSIITANPSFSGSYKTSGTQALTLALDVQHAKRAAELRDEAESLEKEIQLYQKAVQTYSKKDPALSKRFQDTIESRTAELNGVYEQLGDAILTQDPVAPPVAAPNQDPPPSLDGYDLATTLWSVRQQLLNVNHAQEPCVKPSELKTQVDFQIVKSAKVGVEIDILILSVGASAETTNDSVQSLVVTFDMAGSSLLLVQ